MAEPYLAPHPWDSIGKPPPPGPTYEPKPEPVKAQADYDGFTDSKGRHIDFEKGIEEAARCILDQGDSITVEHLVRDSLSPDEILEWIVYPDTGEFADDVA